MSDSEMLKISAHSLRQEIGKLWRRIHPYQDLKTFQSVLAGCQKRVHVFFSALKTASNGEISKLDQSRLVTACIRWRRKKERDNPL